MVAREVSRRWYYLILLAVFKQSNHHSTPSVRPHTHDEIGRYYERRHSEEGQDSVWDRPDPGCYGKEISNLVSRSKISKDYTKLQ